MAIERRIRATAPMFVPGFGAFVRLEQRLATARENARVGIAGPWWGLGAALAAYGIYAATDAAIFAAIAHAGAFLNLFNLIPLWQLDGGRAFEPLTLNQRIQCVLVILGAWILTQEGLFAILFLAAVFRAFTSKKSSESDPAGTVHYVVVLAGLALLMTIRVPGT